MSKKELSMPRVVREGIIECPKCGWKQSSENKECAWCDFKFPEIESRSNNDNFKIQNNKPKFSLDKLKIKSPFIYIYDYQRYSLKKNNEFFKLIDNLNEFTDYIKDIIDHFDEIIDKANDIFIKEEQDIICSKFKNDLKTHKGIFTSSDKKNLKEKYNKSYADYYKILNLDYYIDKKNEKIINKEKNLILNDFNKKLHDCKSLISNSGRDKLKKEYNKDYYPFYDELNFDSLIDDFNNNLKIKLKILDDFKKGYIPQSEKLEFKQGLNLNFDIDELVDEHNNEYIKEQSNLNKYYFENIAGKSLDSNQIRAVLTDDDNTQIVAGAGTGKTLTIQAKVKYLIEKQGVPEEDILCISFSRSARRDLENKIEKTIGKNNVDVRTFHSLGYNILGMDGGYSEVPDGEIGDIIDGYFKESFLDDSQFIKKVIEFFAYYYNIIHINNSNFKFQTIRSKINELDEYEEFLKEYLNVTQINENKEYMTNFNELITANYLFIHNIDYECSKIFKIKGKNYDSYVEKYIELLFGENEVNIPKHVKLEFIKEFDEDFACEEKEFYPNFFLPEYDVYISLAPFKYNWMDTLSDENKEKLIKQLKIRDNINNKNKTKLFTIFDYGDDVDLFLEVLENTLKNNHVELKKINYKKLFEVLILEENLPEYKIFIKTINTFINLFKGNALYIDSKGNDISKLRFKQYLEENNKEFLGSLGKRNIFFLEIIEKVYEKYVERLKQEGFIDFNDMINDAVIALKNGAYIHNYKYIIVDEYQDTSHTRYNLLREMQNSTGAKVVVVGDDWQSIYGFTGCDVRLFSEFDLYFKNPKMVKIEITYRNSQELIDVVGKFIQKNKKQIPKQLKSDDKLTKKPIKLVGCMSKSDRVLSLIHILDEISLKKSNAHILILGRNNRDIYEISCKEIFELYKQKDYTQIIYENNPKLEIEFRTIHKSKGLEADYVVVLNLTDKLNGFPNKIENDPILNFVNNKENENIDFPEERRLFYVALTRTKNDVFLFHNELRPSIFVNEIKNDEKVQSLRFEFSNDEIIRINSLLDKRYEVIETDNICPKCKSGNVNLIINNENGTSYFKCSNFCGWDGGPYHNSSYGYDSRKISYVKYAKVCNRCGGMLIVKSQRENPDRKFLGCNFYQKRNCINSESLPIDFDKFDEEVYELNMSRNGVFYLHEYVPPKKINPDESNEITNLILDYKDGKDGYSINLFTKELMEAITFISNKHINENIKKIALVTAPSSKVTRNNKFTMLKSVDLIENWYKQGLVKINFGLEKEIINCKDLIKRVKNVPTAHLGEGRASCKQHFNSMKCSDEKLSQDIVYIILDDITTTGDTMKACKKVLMDNDAVEDNVYMLTIGGTVRENNEEI